MTFLVDSGASDTVVPPTVCASAQLHMTAKVGTEYEVADGGVVENLGEKRCLMKVNQSTSSAEATSMVFQVVDVSKPLLSVCKVCQAGHQVVFGKDESAIWVGGDSKNKIPLRNNAGTFELDCWIRPDETGFSRPK